MEPIELLREDFSQSLGFIDKCDEHIFKIKNWALVTTSAIIAFSISQNHKIVTLVNLPMLIAFMYLELIYKSFQDTAIEHTSDISERIDRFIEENTAARIIEGYSHSFGRKLEYPSIRRVFSILSNRNRWHILNFYILLALFSISAFLLGDRFA